MMNFLPQISTLITPSVVTAPIGDFEWRTGDVISCHFLNIELSLEECVGVFVFELVSLGSLKLSWAIPYKYNYSCVFYIHRRLIYTSV